MKILLVEDEETLREAVRYGLEREGFRVSLARDGKEALEKFRGGGADVILLDLMLPEVSGLDVCKAIRARSPVPIIILTAKDSEADKVLGLELGADDYVTKPFSMRELIARVRAVSRRGSVPVSPGAVALKIGGVTLDPDAHEVRVDGAGLELPPKEFELLHSLMSRAGRLVTRQTLIDEVWGPEYVGDTRTLDVHVKRLRQKIESDPRSPRYIKTVRGLGYKFEDPKTGSGRDEA
ncbi:MAG TPA: response regulator transcription factor [Actinomycetota bacterium]|nr:response regulator transcription factor [Actinomycetota bacterium]